MGGGVGGSDWLTGRNLARLPCSRRASVVCIRGRMRRQRSRQWRDGDISAVLAQSVA